MWGRCVAVVIAIFLLGLPEARATATQPHDSGAVSLSGVVTDRDGNPWLNLQVSLIDRFGSEFSAAQSDDGSYSITVTAGSYALHVAGRVGTLAEYFNVDVKSNRFDLLSNRIQDISLPDARITLAVTDPNGDPVAGANAEPFGEAIFTLPGGLGLDGSFTTNGQSDSNGQLLLPLPVGARMQHGIVVKPPTGSGLARATLQPDITGDTTIPVTLPYPVTFGGSVEDGNAAPLSYVTLSLADSLGNYTVATAGADGSFSMQLAPDVYTVGITGSFSYGTSSVTLGITEGGVAIEHDVSATMRLPVVAVPIAVTDPDGNAVSDARIQSSQCTAVDMDPLIPGGATTTLGGYNAFAQTDNAGSATLEALPCANPISFAITPPVGSGLAPASTTNVTIADGVSLSIQLPRAITLSGAVLDEHGNPIPNTSIIVTDNSGAITRTTSASDGSYSIDIGAGAHTVELAVGYYDAPEPISFDLTSELDVDTTEQLNFTLPDDAVTVNVSDSLGNSIADVSVRSATDCWAPDFPLFSGGPTAGGVVAYSSAPPTDATGAAVVHLVPCATATNISILPPQGHGLAGTTLPSVEFTDGTAIGVELYSLSGALDDSNNSPLAGQTVSLKPSGAMSPAASARRTASVKTTKAGFFGLTVAPGTYDLTVKGQSKRGTSIPFAYAVTVTGVDLSDGVITGFTLPRIFVKVKVRDASHSLVSGASVDVPCVATAFDLYSGAAASGSVCGHAVTAANGVAKVALLPAASATFTVTPPAGSSCPASVNGVVVDRDRSLSVVLPAC